MAEPIKEKTVLIIKVGAKFLILLLAVIFVLYHSGEFFGIAATGSLFDRILLVPSLVFILRMGMVVFLAVAFGLLVTILFKDVEGFKIGSWEVQFTKQASEGAKITISELEQVNKKLREEVEALKAENNALQKAANQAYKLRGEKK